MTLGGRVSLNETLLRFVVKATADHRHLAVRVIRNTLAKDKH